MNILRRYAQGVSLTIAILLFVLVGAFALSSCQTYQPPCPDCWLTIPRG